LFFFAPTSFVNAQARYENAPINYSESEPTEKVFQLARAIADGSQELVWEQEHGYLKSLLISLEIPQSSQGLVFSKTSLQVSRISPARPRAIYFSDDVYVGWVQDGSVIEISAADAKLGATFYSIKQDQAAKQKIVRETSRCLQCHGSSHTRGRPGHIVRSVFPNQTGMPEYSLGTHLISPQSKFEDRFGGWFVSGTHGDLRHMGNSWMPKSTKSGYQRFNRDQEELDREKGANQTDLAKLLNVKPYLVPTSDIVAQLVLQHQVHMHNVLTEANYAGQQALHDAAAMNKIFKRGEGFESDSTRRRFDSASKKVVKALLFCEELELTSPIKGDGDFAKHFESLGPFDSGHRSLRDFDLTKRMFRFPCSFLIYSDAFRALPEGVLTRVYSQLDAILSGENEDDEFDHLSAEDRVAIREILNQTGVDLK